MNIKEKQKMLSIKMLNTNYPYKLFDARIIRKQTNHNGSCSIFYFYNTKINHSAGRIKTIAIDFPLVAIMSIAIIVVFVSPLFIT